MTLRGLPVGEHERSDCFASFFEEKVKGITDNTIVDPLVYNGKTKLEADSRMFMSANEVRKCFLSIKLKKTVRALTESLRGYLSMD